MSLFTLGVLLVHWLHVFAGIIWLGSSVFISVALWPMLLRRPAPEAWSIFQAMVPTLGKLMGGSAWCVLLLGVVRGTLAGQIQSVSALVLTPYGATFSLAVLLMLFLFVWGHAVRRQLPDRVWDRDRFRPGAAKFLTRMSVIQLSTLCAILGCMVLMRFGL